MNVSKFDFSFSHQIDAWVFCTLRENNSPADKPGFLFAVPCTEGYTVLFSGQNIVDQTLLYKKIIDDILSSLTILN